MKTKILAAMLFLALTVAGRADTRVVEMRITGEHKPVTGDTIESARLLALADARHKAVHAAVGHLQQRADVKALRLRPAQLEAYAAVLVDLEDQQAGATRTATPVRAQVMARLDAGDAARRMAGLHKDQDASFELIGAWTRTQQLHRQLAEQTRRRAAATTQEAGIILQEQLKTVAGLGVTQLTAKAYAVLARTEPATVGGRATPAGGTDRARQLAEAALALSPDSPDAHYLMGDLLIEAAQPAAAEAAYRKALGDGGPSIAGRTKLAAALRYQGKLSEALAELRDAQQVDPAFARAHGELGVILGAQKSLPEALAAYREAIRLDPDSIDAHNGLAVALASSGKLEDAVAEFREIIRIDPDSTIGYYNLAYALADLDRDVESAAALREVLRINPNHYNARFNLGELFRLEGKYDDSANQFREYLRLAPDTPGNQRNITRATGYIRQFEDPDAPEVGDSMRRR